MKALGLTMEVIGALWAALTTHELGHVIAGRSQRFVFQFLAVGPLWVERSPDGGYAVRFNRSPVAWGGRTRMHPTDAERLVHRYAVFVAGGPIASAFLALAAWGVGVLWPQGVGENFFAPLAVLSLAVAIGTAQPFGSGGGFASDGGALRTLLGGGDRAERAAALLALAGALVTGVRPRDLPAETVGRALVPSDGSLEELMALTTAASHGGSARRPRWLRSTASSTKRGRRRARVLPRSSARDGSGRAHATSSDWTVSRRRNRPGAASADEQDGESDRRRSRRQLRRWRARGAARTEPLTILGRC
jgi:peptidase M50-like protein